MMPTYGFAGAEIIFLLVWLLFLLGGIAGWIVLLVAAWRLMRAHESVAESLKVLAAQPTDKA